MEAILLWVGRILDILTPAQMELFALQLTAIFDDFNDENSEGEYGFTGKEIALFRTYNPNDSGRLKVLAIKARRQRTNESLHDCVQDAKKLFASRGWKW